MQKMRIVIREDGSVHIEVIGGDGVRCLDFTRDLEKRLGLQIGERKMKAEDERNQVVVHELEHC